MSAEIVIFTPMEQLPNRIRLLRKQADLSIKELADIAGMNYVTLSHLERGSRQLHVEYMRSIARGLNCKAADLLNDDDVSVRLDDDETQMILALRTVAPDLRRHLCDHVTGFAPQPELKPYGETGDSPDESKAA